jgi:hypothetical protein
MGVDMIISIVIGMIRGASAAYKFAQEIKGEVAIPSWDDLIAANSDLQDKIDKEG